jgi:hypothetical protein
MNAPAVVSHGVRTIFIRSSILRTMEGRLELRLCSILSPVKKVRTNSAMKSAFIFGRSTSMFLAMSCFSLLLFRVMMPTASGGNIGLTHGADSKTSLLSLAAFGTAWLVHLYRDSGAVAHADSAAPQVVASKPLVRELNSRLGFLGQFSAVDEVELRAQVGGRHPTGPKKNSTWAVKP